MNSEDLYGARRPDLPKAVYFEIGYSHKRSLVLRQAKNDQIPYAPLHRK